MARPLKFNILSCVNLRPCLSVRLRLYTPSECTTIAHRHSRVVFCCKLGDRRDSRNRNHCRFYRRENSRSLAIFDCKENRASWSQEIVRLLRRGVKIAAATAENRDFGAISSFTFVHTPFDYTSCCGILVQVGGDQ